MSIKTKWKQPMAKFLAILLLLAVLATSFPQPASAAPLAVACAYKHKVQPGETLVYLGYIYQIDWLKIAEANKLSPPYLLVVGQVLCIPVGAKPPLIGTSDGTGSKKDEPTLTVVATISGIIVSVENFPRLNNYFVRVIPKLTPVHYRLGRLRTNKDGKATEHYQIPEFLLDRRFLIICVKDVMTDATLCVEYENPYWMYWQSQAYCVKNGR